jgi:hypothetical protein
MEYGWHLNDLDRFDVRRLLGLSGVRIEGEEIDRVALPIGQALEMMLPLLKEKISKETEPTSYLDRLRAEN